MHYSYSTYSDEILIQLLKKGDDDAYTEIYNRYWDKIYQIACVKLRDFYLAEEVLQEVFLELWRRKEHLNVNNNLSAYLFVALKNRVINARIKQNRIDNNLEEYANYHRSKYEFTFIDYMDFKELNEKLNYLVQDLPEKCRLVYKLSRGDGFSHKEIADKLNISEKSVEAHLTRALKKIKINLKFIVLYINILKIIKINI